MPFPLTLYQVKRMAVYPRILAGRHRERHQSPFMQKALDLGTFGSAVYGFIGASMENPSLLYDVDVAEGGIALDVGAYVGTWARALTDRSPGATVHCFELSPAVIPELAANVASTRGVRLHAFGLGGADGLVRISRRGLGSSVFHISRGDASDEGVIRDIAGVWEELGLGRVAVMKVNIEGGEYDLLDRMAEAGLLPLVDTFLIQFHEWFPGGYRRRRAIRRQLQQTHEVVWDYPFVWERWQRRAVG